MKGAICAAALLALAFGATLALAKPRPAAVPAGPAAPSGKQVYDRWCAACHAPGRRIPGTAALAAKYGADVPAALEQRKDLDPAVIKYFVRQGVSIMPSFRKTEITDRELDALAGYLGHKPGR